MKKIFVGQLEKDMHVAINKLVNFNKTLVEFKLIDVVFCDTDEEFEHAELTLQDVWTNEIHKETWYTVETIRLVESRMV